MGAKPITQQELDARKAARANPGAQPFDAQRDNAGNRTATDFKRGLLAVLTLGTSEIKTGAGANGDEVLADSLFPKEINNFLLDDREAERKYKETAATQAAAKAMPGPVPDLADQLLQRAGSSSLLRQQTRQGRKSTFLSGGGG